MKTLQAFKYILLLIGICALAPVNNIYAQKKHTHKKTAKHTYKDSIGLRTIVSLDSEVVAYKNKKATYAQIVKFTVKITNGSHTVIPDPVKYKGEKFVKMFINGQPHTPKTLFDDKEDITDKDNIIAPGQSQTFYCDWLTSSRSSLLKKYGAKFTVQFSYIHIRSHLYHVDLNKLKMKS
jgi:hypothetical protein